MTIKSRGLARRRNTSKSRARKPSKAKQALLKRAQFFKAHAGGIVGEAMKGAVALARAEMLLEAAKEAGIAEVKWQQDDDVDTSWMDKKDMEDYRSGRVEYLGCVIEVNGEHCGSLWGIGLLGGRSDPYARVIEAELALECEDALKAGLRKAQRSARRGLKIKPNARRGSPRGRRKNSSMVHGSKELGGRMMEWQAPSEPQVGGVGSHFYAGMPVPMASAEEALRDLKSTLPRILAPARDRKHLSKVISDLSKVIAKAKKTNPKFRVDFDSPQFGRGGMDIDVTPTESGHHVDIDIDQHKHRFGFDVSAHQLPEHAGEPEATEAVMGDVPESAVVSETEPATVTNRGRRAKRLGRRSNCGGMKMNPARFRLFDNGDKTADRYTLIDSKPEGKGRDAYYTYFGFNSEPWHPQGIGQHGEFSASQWAQMGDFRHLGKRIGLEDLDPELRKYISNLIKKWGGDPKSAMRGRHSLASKAATKKTTRKGKKANPSSGRTQTGSRLYVGLLKDGHGRELFRSKTTPTERSHGDRYGATIGPFRTKRAAELMAIPGNILWTVSEAERAAAHEKRKGKKTNRGTWDLESRAGSLRKEQTAARRAGDYAAANRLAEEIKSIEKRLQTKANRGRKPARRTNRPRKSMREFIREHREELDTAIRGALKKPDFPMNDRERELWILNDEGLYGWARSEGVRV